MPTSIIGSVQATPAQPRPAESTLIEIFAPDGSALGSHSDTTVYINGVPGARQYLQFPSEGARGLLVTAFSSAGSDSAEQTITVSGEPLRITLGAGASARQPTAMMHMRQSLRNAYEITFTLGDAPLESVDTPIRSGPEIRPHELTLAAMVDDQGDPRSLSRAIVELAPTDGRFARRRLKTTPVARRATVEAFTASLGTIDIATIRNKVGTRMDLTFEWDFGDGTTATTSSPRVTHDYSPAENWWSRWCHRDHQFSAGE